MDRRHTAPSPFDRARAYLATRTTECWAFFAAGFIVCAILT